MEVGRYTYGTQNIQIHWPSGKTLKIGKFCSIATNCTVYLGGSHRTDWITTYPFGHIHQNVFNNYGVKQLQEHPHSKGDVIIGNDVWIASDVSIMSGVKIGDGAVIARNSHVVKDVEPYSIVGGNPARHVKYRFSNEQIQKLLTLKWWDWPESKINEYVPVLCSGDIDLFLQKCNN